MKQDIAEIAEEAFYIVDVRQEFKGRPYITVWRPKNAGYAYPLAWAGRYTREQVDAQPGYYHKRRYRSARALDRYPVPCSVVERLAVAPAPGVVDGDAGPVLPNHPAIRAALSRARYTPAHLLAHSHPEKQA